MANSKFTVDEINEFKEAFDFHDLDHDGKISTSLICDVMMCLGHNVTENELDKLLVLNPATKGQVDFNTFVSLMELKDTKRETKQEVLTAFSVFDDLNKNYVGGTDLKRLVERFGHGNMRNLDVDDMIQQADTRGNNRIYYKELIDEMVVPLKK